MNLRTLDQLVCPKYKTPLELLIFEEKTINLNSTQLERINRMGLDKEKFQKEIISGALINKEKKIYYPIYKGVPRLLTYKCGIFDSFERDFHNRITNELKGYSLPEFPPPVGEEDVIRSFSVEWLNYDWDPNSYWSVSAETLFKIMHSMLNLDNISIKDKVVLEVGIGIGGIANDISLSRECDLFGIDLSYAVDAAYKNFGGNPFLHIIQASAFSLPFSDNSFDFVYSQGVLHHSSDPKTCFINVSKTVKSRGHLYVWLYSTQSEKRNLLRRILMVVESILRPFIWNLPVKIQNIILFPIALLYIFHQNVIQRKLVKNKVKYGLREALHAARDRFTPRYAFRFSEDEVIGWFNQTGFENLLPGSKRKFPNFIVVECASATTVIGQKK